MSKHCCIHRWNGRQPIARLPLGVHENAFLLDQAQSKLLEISPCTPVFAWHSGATHARQHSLAIWRSLCEAFVGLVALGNALLLAPVQVSRAVSSGAVGISLGGLAAAAACGVTVHGILLVFNAIMAKVRAACACACAFSCTVFAI